MKRKKSIHRSGPAKQGLRGREIELDIDSVSNSGEGVGRSDNRVGFVPYTMPGDRVRVQISEDKRTFFHASVREILSPSVDRIEPRCKYFTDCGGCDWQHMPYSLQLESKSSQLADTLTRIGGVVDVAILPIISSDKPYHYRNRIQGLIRDGKFYKHRKNSNGTVCIDACLIADERINEVIRNNVSDVEDGKVELAVVDQQVEILPLQDRSTELGFRQVNTAISERLAELVLQIIAASQCEHVYDFYCGRGVWTNQIALNHPLVTVTGVDAAIANIEFAKSTALDHKLENVSYLHAKAEDSLSVLSQKKSLCIVDPPRTGLDVTVTQALCKKRQRDLIYISCHPATLARDLKVLMGSNYVIKTIQPLDMFPQTAHTECLVHLQSGKA